MTFTSGYKLWRQNRDVVLNKEVSKFKDIHICKIYLKNFSNSVFN